MNESFERFEEHIIIKNKLYASLNFVYIFFQRRSIKMERYYRDA